MSNQQLKTVQHAHPEVYLNADGQLVASSINIAAVFDKQHKNILPEIEKLIQSGQINGLNFQPVEYVDLKGESRKMYELQELACHILILSFTGLKALAYKVWFVKEFLRMRQVIETEMQNKFLALEIKLKDEIMLRDGRNFWLQDENSRLKSIMWKQTQKDQRKGTRVTPEENMEIKKLYASGLCKAEIGRRTGRSPGIINRAINMSVTEASLGARHVH